MQISGPVRYAMLLDPTGFRVTCPRGTPKFSGNATSKKPKLYVVSVNRTPVYVGVTKQSMRSRLRYGWTADGSTGYHGYRWRHHLTEADLNIWVHENAPEGNPVLDIETVEAELVFLIRQAGEWPLYQTEIHFHPSSPDHRQVAASIFSHFFAVRIADR